MTFRGLVIKFGIEPGEHLRPLVAMGYSPPPSKDNIVLTKLTDYGSIEVHKKDDETVMVLLKPGEQCVGQLVSLALEHLERAGLYTDVPF